MSGPPLDDLIFGTAELREQVARCELKAVSLAARRDAVRESFGEDGVAAVLQKLPEEAKRVWGSERTLPFAWLPIAPFLHVDRAILSELLDDDLDRLVALVVRQSEAEVKTLYRFLLRLGGPQFVFKRIGVTLETKVRPGGMHLVELRDKGGVSEIRDMVLPPYVCQRTAPAWADRALELSGARDVVTDKSACVHRGDAVCRYETRWS